MRFCLVEDLKSGDLVDLEGDRIAKIGADVSTLISYQCEYGMVDWTYRNPESGAGYGYTEVYFENFPGIVFPQGHIVRVVDEFNDD